MNNKIKEKIKGRFDVVLDSGTTIIGAVMTDTIIGQVAPGITTAYLGYKQKRAEQNILLLIDGVSKRQSEFDERLSKLEENQFNVFKERYFPMVLDYVIDEPQEEKIKYMINGLLSITEVIDLQEDFFLNYYDLLKELRVSDILVLLYSNEEDIIRNSCTDIDDANIKIKAHRNAFKNKILFNDNQINCVQEKLQSKGIYSKLYLSDEDDNDDNECNFKFVTELGRNFLEFFKMTK